MEDANMLSPNEDAAARLAWEMDSWKSIAIRSHVVFENYRDTPGLNEFTGYSADYRYVETADGKRLFEQTMKPSNGANAIINIDYCDGRLSAWMSRKEDGNGVTREQVTIKHTFSDEDRGSTHRPDPLKHYFVGLEPLHRALARATYLGKSEHLGRECHRFLFQRISSGSTTLDFVYWIDVEYSIPIKVEYFMNDAARAANEPVAVWKATSFDTVEGHHIPLNCVLERFTTDGSNVRHLLHKHVTVVDNVQYNSSYPTAMFWPKIGPRTAVNDLVKRKFVFPKADSALTTTASPTEVMRVDQEHNFLSASSVLFGIGLIVIVAACLIRWRMR
jgi:hypothetical protein